MSLARPLIQLQPTGDTRLTELELEFGNGQERMVGLLALSMAFQRDASLRASLASRVDDRRLAVALSDKGPYLVIDDGKLAGAAMAGEPPPGLALVELRAAVESSPATFAAFHRTYRVAHADADRMMRALRDDAEQFSREAFVKLVRWAPVIAADAYRQAALLQSIFDLGRARVLADPQPEPLHAYWMHVHLLGHLTVLATAAEPTTWLADMARAFPWRVWTPSFPLVRERIARLAVRGAWASARFGTSTVDRYLGNLDAPQLLRVFDAVLALVSIATACERDQDRDAIARELVARLDHRARAATTVSEHATLEALQRSARLALESPDDAERALVGDRLAARAEDRLDVLARFVDSDRDAAELDDRGLFPTILAMAKLATAPAAIFFPPETRETPATRDRDTRWRPARALDALSRTLDRPIVDATDVPHRPHVPDDRRWN